MIHLTDIRRFTRCDKYYWYATQQRPAFFPFAITIEDPYELAKKYLNVTKCFEGKRGDDATEAVKMLATYDVLMNARFAYMDLRVTVPFLFKSDLGYKAVFVYQQCYPKESEAIKIADTLFVLEKNNIVVSEVEALHLNANYVRGEKLDIFACLTITNQLYNDRNHANRTIMELVELNKRDLTPIIEAIHQCPDMSDVEKKRSSACTNHFKCEYFNSCFSKDAHPTSVLNLVSSQKKYELYDQGVDDLSMINEGIEGTRAQYAQIMAAKKQGLFVDRYALKQWLCNFVYPLTYLDFEWETYVYPPYLGMKPFDVLVFQYSMHIQKEKGGRCAHEQFLMKKDCREAFIVDLVKRIPKKGSVVVFNAVGAEKLRLQQLAIQFTQYAQALEQIWTRMIDIALPFSIGVVYDDRMAGEYNLKKLVSLFSDYSYSDLAISQGMEAVRKWREMEKENPEIEEQLYEYCGMDTYSMVILMDFLNRQVN